MQEDDPTAPKATLKQWNRDDVPPERRLNFALIKDDVDVLLESFAEKVDREWPKRLAHLPGLHVYTKGTVLAARSAYGAVRHLCSDESAKELHRLQYVTAAAAIVRTIMDSVCTMAFMFEKPEERYRAFERSGWREEHEELARLSLRYGDRSEWSDWLRARKELSEWLANRAGITEADRANLKRIDYWPNPGKMPAAAKDPELKARLEYLRDWFYKELSAESHLSLTGFARRASVLLGFDRHHERIPGARDVLDKLRSDSVFTTLTALLALLSEVEVGMGIEPRPKLREIWRVVASYWGPADELYEAHYAGLLARRADAGSS